MQGRRIAILESRLGPQLVELIAHHGGEPLHAPALAEIPDIDRDFIAGLVDDLDRRPAQVAVFQTGVGMQALFKTADALDVTARFLAHLAKMTVVARGPKPAGVLRARGVRIDHAVGEPFTTREVLAALRDAPLGGSRALVQRYGVRNQELDDALRAAGAEVVEIPTYRWVLPENTRPLISLIDAFARDEVDALAVTNAAQIDNLFELAGRLGRADALRAALERALVASIGPVTSKALHRHGVTVGLEATPPKLGPLIAALAGALAG